MAEPISFIKTEIAPNFVYPEITSDHFRFGSGQLAGTILRPDGDWRDYLPPEEDQNVRGIESSACYIESPEHSVATIEEEKFGEIDNNYSARFNALLSGGTPSGGDPLKGIDSIRNDGLVFDKVMPFGDDILSWEDFHSWKGVNEAITRAIGRVYRNEKDIGYDIVFEKDVPVEIKYVKLKEALKYSPCPVSVVGWYSNDGIYYKPEGLRDNHLVECVFVDEFNQAYIRDTYAPYLKKLAPNYNFDFGMRLSVEKKSAPINYWQQIADALKKISDLLFPQPMPQVPPPPPINRPTLVDFCSGIRDFEGYTVGTINVAGIRVGGTRSWRNKNPGNCKFSKVGYAAIYGPVGKDKDGFAIFKDDTTGWLYLQNLVRAKVRVNPNQTIYEFMCVFAPKEDRNDPLRYSQFLANRLGVPISYQMKFIV